MYLCASMCKYLNVLQVSNTFVCRGHAGTHVHAMTKYVLEDAGDFYAVAGPDGVHEVVVREERHRVRRLALFQRRKGEKSKKEKKMPYG